MKTSYWTVVSAALLATTHYAGAAEKAAEEESAPKPAVVLPRADPPLFAEFNTECKFSKGGSVENPALLLLLGTVLKPLVETAIPAAVGWLYDKGVEKLEKINSRLTASSTAINTTVFYHDDKKFEFGCISLGRAVRAATVDEPNYRRKYRGGEIAISPTSDWALTPGTKTKLEALKIARVPEFYMEIAFDSVPAKSETDPKVLEAIPTLIPKGKTALTAAEKAELVNRKSKSLYRTVTPSALYYLASGAEKVGNDGEKHVSVEIHLDAMDTTGEWKPFYSKTYDLGRLRIGSEKISLASLGKDTFIPPPLRHTADGYIDPVPVRLTAVLTETDDNNDLARSLETAFKDEQTKKSTVEAIANVVVDKLQAKIDEKTGTTPAPAPVKK